MTIRSLWVLSSLAALGVAPLTAHANGADKAADACIQAFVDTYLPKDRQVQVRNQLAPAVTSSYARRYTIDLSARLTRTGAELVTARCTASITGRVIGIDAVTEGSAAGRGDAQK